MLRGQTVALPAKFQITTLQVSLISCTVRAAEELTFSAKYSARPAFIFTCHSLHPGCILISTVVYFAFFLHWGETLRRTSPWLHKEIILFTQSELMTLSEPLMILLALRASNSLVITSKQ